ncbi:Tad domain-containing protein [Wenxinia marina]|nr:Tad domain-containing protein [Wenxinia marina]
MTIFGMFLFVTTCVIGGMALDVTHLYAARTQLQVAADLAGHAAIYTRESRSENTARLTAIEAVRYGMPEESFGDVLDTPEIVFGVYENGAFSPLANSRSAVMVTTHRSDASNNPVDSFLYRMIGKDDWDVVTRAVYATYRPACFREGIAADGVVDLQSNNGFYAGFCVHSNEYVSLNQNNFFEPGTVVSMPNEEDIDLPNSGFEKNEGLQAALRSGAYRLRLINQLPQIIENLRTRGTEWTPDYISSALVRSITNVRKVAPADLTPGTTHFIACNGSNLTLDAGTYQSVVIVTPCDVKFSNGVILEDAVVATTSINDKSMSAPNGLQIGRNDDCADGGGAQLLTLGGIDVASSLTAYNGQLVAAGDVHYAANADGIRGISIVAGGEVHGTSNMRMGFCGDGMENNFEVDYFRLVQ